MVFSGSISDTPYKKRTAFLIQKKRLLETYLQKAYFIFTIFTGEYVSFPFMILTK
jgi:hypothetical protein